MEVLVQNNLGGAASLSAEMFLQELAQGRMWREVPASVDGGKTWAPAWQLEMRLRARGDDGLAFVMPMRTEAWSMISGYLAILSAFLRRANLVRRCDLAFDHGPTKWLRLAFVVGGLLLSPAPIALTAELGRRALLRDPTLRGKGRMIFGFVVAGFLVLPCLVGLFGVLLR